MQQLIHQLLHTPHDAQSAKHNWKQLRMEVTNHKNQNEVLAVFEEDGECFDRLFRMVECLGNDEQMRLFYVQFWANWITANEKTRRYFLERSENAATQEFEHALVGACKQSATMLKTCYVLCFNLLHGTDQPRREQLLFRHGLVCPLALDLMSWFFGEPQPAFAETHLEWVAYLFEEIFSHGVALSESYLERVVQQSGSHERPLSFVVHYLQKTLDEQKFPSLLHAVNTDIYEIQQVYSKGQYKLGMQLHLPDMRYLLKQFTQHANALRETLHLKDRAQTNASAAWVQQCLQVFCLVTFLGGFNPKVQLLFMEEAFLANLELLILLKHWYDKRELAAMMDKQYYDDLLCLFLRFNGNMLHTNKRAQQLVTQEKRYYACLLGFSRFDSQQVGLKECGIFIMRNLCEDNEELRKVMQVTE